MSDHYNGTECLDAIKKSMSPEAYKGFLKGNVMKYMWRYEKKIDPVGDLQKAQQYLYWLRVEILLECEKQPV
jgi:hypothetical protein